MAHPFPSLGLGSQYFCGFLTAAGEFSEKGRWPETHQVLIPIHPVPQATSLCLTRSVSHLSIHTASTCFPPGMWVTLLGLGHHS